MGTTLVHHYPGTTLHTTPWVHLAATADLMAAVVYRPSAQRLRDSVKRVITGHRTYRPALRLSEADSAEKPLVLALSQLIEKAWPHPDGK